MGEPPLLQVLTSEGDEEPPILKVLRQAVRQEAHGSACLGRLAAVTGSDHPSVACSCWLGGGRRLLEEIDDTKDKLRAVLGRLEGSGGPGGGGLIMLKGDCGG